MYGARAREEDRKERAHTPKQNELIHSTIYGNGAKVSTSFHECKYCEQSSSHKACKRNTHISYANITCHYILLLLLLLLMLLLLFLAAKAFREYCLLLVCISVDVLFHFAYTSFIHSHTHSLVCIRIDAQFCVA